MQIVAVIEESNEEQELLGMLLPPKRLITYVYPLLLVSYTSKKYLKSGDR
jgi:hypothetical protein